jgi:hypothetical protein
MESYSIPDQSGTWSPESSWVPTLFALLLRSRHTRSEKNNGVSGKTDTAGKPTYESFWLLLYPMEADRTSIRAGLYIEKESTKTIRGDLEEITVTVV